MSTSPAHPEPTTDETAYYKAILHELVDMAADLARIAYHRAKRHAVQQDEAATAAVPPIPAANDRFPDPAIAFDRIARTIRHTIALARVLGQPARPNATSHRIATRKRVLRRIEDIIHSRAKPDQAAPLRAELRERLDAPDFADDLETIPFETIVETIARDLHLAHDPKTWKRRTPQDVASLHEAAAAIPPTWRRPGPDDRPLTSPQTSSPQTSSPYRKYHIRT